MQRVLNILLLPVTATVAAVRWFGNASVAARIAWIVALFQVVVVVLALVVVLSTRDRAIIQSWWSPGKGLVLLLLMALVPLLVYRAARLWLERQDGRWPDIAAAWETAIAELGRQQVFLAESPLFLVLGSDGGDFERALFAEMSPALVVEQSPLGGGPLHVFASHDAVFVCCSGTGQTSVVAAAVRSAIADEGHAIAGGKAIADHAAVGQESEAVVAAVQTASQRRLPLRSASERREASDRLAYACEQVRQARIPLAAINGVVVLLPVQVNHAAEADATSIGQAVSEDLATVTRVLGVRAPVTFVAGVLQDDPAIDELMSRLDASSRSAACGQPFPPGLPPTPEHLQALALNAIGSLNDRLANLLLDPRRIAQDVANRQLLALLLRLRLHVSTQVHRVLQQTFTPELPVNVDGRPGVLPLLAGCYLASISPNANRRAFVQGLLDRVVHLQGELDWTDESLRAEAWARRTSRVLFALAAAFVVAILAIVWWKATR
jgi:hypothetical protein